MSDIEWCQGAAPEALHGGGMRGRLAAVVSRAGPLVTIPLTSEVLHLSRHLALPEAGDADRAREVGRGVLDRVLELVRRDVDLEADAVPAELLDLAHRPAPGL